MVETEEATFRAAVEKIERAGTLAKPTKTDPDGSFVRDGVLYARRGGKISLGSATYRIEGGASMARFLFRKLTIAGLDV